MAIKALTSSNPVTRAKAAASAGYISVAPRTITSGVPKSTLGTGGSSLGATGTRAATGPTTLNTGNLNTTNSTGYQQQIASILQNSGLGNLAGYVPGSEYQGEITQDPQYQLGLQNMNQANDQARQALRSQIQQAIIGYGAFDPSKIGSALGSYAGDVDQTTLDAANANQFSTTGQLRSNLNNALSALPYNLAARGVVRSGAAAQKTGMLNQQYDVASNQGLSSLLGVLRGNVSDYSGALGTIANNFEQTKNSVASRLAQIAGYNQPTQNIDWDSIMRGVGALGGDQTTPEPAAPTTVPGTPGYYATTRPTQFAALSSPNAQTRARAAASLGFISPTPTVTIKKKKG